MSVVWEFYTPDCVWLKLRPAVSNHIEETLKCSAMTCKVHPENAYFNANKVFMVHVHTRIMIEIETGMKYKIRRRMPQVTYFTVETGAVGPGDCAEEVLDASSDHDEAEEFAIDHDMVDFADRIATVEAKAMLHAEPETSGTVRNRSQTAV